MLGYDERNPLAADLPSSGGLFERYEPFDTRKVLAAHIELLFAPRRVA